MSYRFANSDAFLILWLIPIVLLLTWALWKRQKKQIAKFLSPKMIPFLAQSVSTRKRGVKLALEILALIFLVVALARPQAGQRKEKAKSEGVDIVILADVSQSMEAEDVKPSRLEFMKSEINRLLDLSTGDRFALIAFAGSATTLSPLTTDHGALKMFVESLSPISVSTQGTDFSRALSEAKDLLVHGGVEPSDDVAVTRVIVIASDGEDQEPGALDAAKKLADEGIRIFTLGFGTEKGAPIPLRDDRGNLTGYLQDKKGQVVLSTTKGTVLQELAAAGKGSFYQATFAGNATQMIYQDLQKLQKSTFAAIEITDYDERYQMFLLFGLVVALIELVLGERKGKARIWRGRFEVGGS